MGVDQPNKRVADQAGKKGKPARKAGANIQSTAGASKPAHAAAPSSSSSSLLLQVTPHVSSFARYRTAFNVGRPLIKVATPRDIANDLLRNLMIKL